MTAVKKRENPWLSLVFNIAVPSLILMKASGPERLGQVNALIVALAFPIFYALYDFVARRNLNFISGLGFVNVLLTGGIGLFQIGGIWFAVKEAAIPALIAVAVLISELVGKPIVRVMLYNDQIMNRETVDAALAKNNAQAPFEELFRFATTLVLISFLLSSVINFALAYWIVISPPGSQSFNEEVGYMNAVSYPVILVCCSSLLVFALWRLIQGIKKLTGLELEQIVRT